MLEAFAQVADLLEALDHDAEQLDAHKSRHSKAAQKQSSTWRARVARKATRTSSWFWTPSVRTNRRVSEMSGRRCSSMSILCNSSHPGSWAAQLRARLQRSRRTTRSLIAASKRLQPIPMASNSLASESCLE